MQSIKQLYSPLRTALPRARPSPSSSAFLSSSLRAASTSAPSSSPSSSASTPTPAASSDASTPPPSHTHYLVTLLRSPLHLPPSITASIHSLGLGKRLSSSIVPISQTNAGYLLKLKDLVGVRTVSSDQVSKWASKEWREREGEGNQGVGMRIGGYGGENSVIRVGSERARGEERGFKVL